MPTMPTPPAMGDATESVLPSVDEVSLRGTAADSSGFQGTHGLSIKGTLIQEATDTVRQIKVKIERSKLA